MVERHVQLFDEFGERYLRGERPDVREYLERAGSEADELAPMIDRFLAAVPAPAASEDTVEAWRAWLAGESPLRALKARRGVHDMQIVEALVDKLGLDRSKSKKVAGYYHELESGELDPRRVDRRVYEVIANQLKARIGDLLAWTRPQPIAPRWFLSAASEAAAFRVSPAQPTEELDEIDRLFLGERT
jgi:hypothetical protein